MCVFIWFVKIDSLLNVLWSGYIGYRNYKYIYYVNEYIVISIHHIIDFIIQHGWFWFFYLTGNEWQSKASARKTGSLIGTHHDSNPLLVC